MRRWLWVPLVFVGSSAQATVIDFTVLSVSPSQAIVFNGGEVTITGQSTALPAIVAGIGLGVAGGLSDGTIDETMVVENYRESGWLTDWHRDSELQLTVTGMITAFTVQPFIILPNGQEPVREPAFQFSFYPRFSGWATFTRFSTISYSETAPVTFTWDPSENAPYTLWYLGLLSNWSPESFMSGYLHDYPYTTISFGLSILSLEYIPTADVVPASMAEPSTLLLLGLALAGLRHRQ